MKQLCPYCGNVLTHEDKCANCESEVAWVKKCYLKSEYYYTKAYEAATKRQLSTAKTLLQKAIHLNKYNIQARNLLGLIYYEIGEVALGLKSWIVSSSIAREDNLACEYIDKVQNNPRVLENYKDTSNLYNKALIYLKQGNEDVAIIRLKKAISINPKFVEGRVLLGICYIKTNQLKKANEQLREALKIDHNHTKALEYIEAIRHEGFEDAKPYEQEYTSKIGSKIGQTKKGNQPSLLERKDLFWRYALYFLMGILCMWIAQRILVVPSKIADYKEEMISLKNEKEALNQAMDTLKLEYKTNLSDLQAENDKLKADRAVYEESMGKKSQQKKLAQSQALITQGDYEGAAQLLYNIATKYLSEEEMKNYIELKESAYNYAVNSLCNKGYSFLKSSAYSEAKVSLETALHYASNEEGKKRVLYYLGCTESGLGNNAKAIEYFNQVINNYPNTTEAMWSENELSTIESSN